MIVMDDLDSTYKLVSDFYSVSSAVSDALRDAVNLLHTANFVHGDIRDVNLMFSREKGTAKVMILDFDWAGVEGQVRYPTNVNTFSVERPAGVSDGELISKQHDLDMLDQIID